MTRAAPKLSPTDDYARRFARAIASGRLPAISADLERYCESSPGEIFAALAGIARHMPPTGKDEALAIGYLFLLQHMLSYLRYRTDQGYADAAGLIADFQADVSARANTGEFDGPLLALVGGALHEAQIPAAPELSAATVNAGNEDGLLPADIRVALASLIEACGGDPFMFVQSVAEFGHALPDEARSGMAVELALGGNADARAAAVLFLLDASAAVRHAAGSVLAEAAASLSPTDVRRLIAMRNWRPESERSEIDAIVRKAREAGIACAQWEPSRTEAIRATGIDGAGNEAFVLVSPAGRKRRVSSILFRGGIADVACGQPESARRVEKMIVAASRDVPTFVVSEAYLDRTVSHHLALTIDNGGAAPIALLQVAEATGSADWQPTRMDFGRMLAALISDLPAAMRAPAARAIVLRDGFGLADNLMVLELSWFEDDPQITEAVTSRKRRDRAKLIAYLLQTTFDRRRDKWADIFLRSALWMREAQPEPDLRWRELAIAAEAIARGRDLTEIGLMRTVASHTIEVLATENVRGRPRSARSR